MRSIRHFGTGIGVALALTASLAGQAWAASRVAYSLEIGGDNHFAEWKATPRQRVAYTRGSGADGQSIYNGNYLNYAVVLEASGIHSQPGHPSDGKEIFGAANVVFNLELLDASNNPVGDAIFKSIINDGNGDPLASAAFSLGFTLQGLPPGRLIDPTTLGGPRLEPIFTYPTAPVGSGTLIGMGAGFKEWIRTGSGITLPGVGMVTVPGPNPATPNVGRRNGLGIVPVAEGQIDISNLPVGTYTLKVTPGNGNNVLRGDYDMVLASNRPAFAVAANEAVGDTITFVVTDIPPVPDGVVAHHVFYNNSAWDDPTKGGSDDTAIATDKSPLLPGSTATYANVINYSKGINGIMIDIGNLARDPVLGQDIQMLVGNANDPFTWEQEAPMPNIQVRYGAGVGGSDRVVLTWPDYPNAGCLPNAKWLLVGIWSGDGSLYTGTDDFFCYGLLIGDGDGDFVVDATDEILARNNKRSGFNPAPVTFIYDYNRDKFVDATDEIIARNSKVSAFTSLKKIAFP